MQETEGLLRDLAHDTADLRRAIGVLAVAMQRSRATVRFIIGGVAAVLVLAVAVGYLAIRSQASLNCVKDWANATSNRSSSLSILSTARFDALDRLLRDARNPDQSKILTDYDAYLHASDIYKKAAADTPVSKLSSFDCSLI